MDGRQRAELATRSRRRVADLPAASAAARELLPLLLLLLLSLVFAAQNASSSVFSPCPGACRQCEQDPASPSRMVSATS